MSIVAKAIAGALRADAAFAALVGTFSGSPAIFAEDLAPPDATMPYVLVRRVASAPFHVLGQKGQRVVIDVHAFISDGVGSGPLDAIEARVRGLLDEPATIPFSVAGYRVDSISVTATTEGAYEPGVTSRVVTLEVLMRRTG